MDLPRVLGSCLLLAEGVIGFWLINGYPEATKQTDMPVSIKRMPNQGGGPVDTSLFVTVILGVLALVGLLLQWNGVIVVGWKISSALYALLCIAILYCFWKWKTARNWPKWRRYMCAVGMFVLFAGISSIGLITQYRREHPEPSTAALEENIKKWGTANRWQLTPIARQVVSGKPIPFEFLIVLPTTGRISVFVNPDWPRVLQIQTKLFFSKDQLDIVNSLGKTRDDAAMQELELEMSRQKIYWKVNTVRDSTGVIRERSILLSSPTPIEDLNEFKFSKAVADMDGNIAFVYTEREVILKRYDKNARSADHVVNQRAGFEFNRSGGNVYLGRNIIEYGGVVKATDSKLNITALDNQSNLKGKVTNPQSFSWDYDDWLQALEDRASCAPPDSKPDVKAMIRSLHGLLEKQWQNLSADKKQQNFNALKDIEQKMLATSSCNELTKVVDYLKSNPPSFARPQ